VVIEEDVARKGKPDYGKPAAEPKARDEKRANAASAAVRGKNSGRADLEIGGAGGREAGRQAGREGGKAGERERERERDLESGLEIFAAFINLFLFCRCGESVLFFLFFVCAATQGEEHLYALHPCASLPTKELIPLPFSLTSSSSSSSSSARGPKGSR
jgi:hypothetical protein